MPSPVPHYRAPLLWLLLPFVAGLAAAKAWPVPSGGLLPFVLLAGALGMAAIGLAGRPGNVAGVAWGACLVGSAGVVGFAYLHLREPHWHEWDQRPPREVTVTLEVLRVYPPAPGARNLAGLGRIVGTSEADRELKGRRVYFSAIRRISLPPQAAGRYVVQGVIESLPREPAEAGFNDYLENLGVRQKLTRAQIQRETQAPGSFRRFSDRARVRLETILQHGLARHPQIMSLYLAMLLGEKAELSGEQQGAFMRSGTFHIFSISGLHVGVIAVALQSLFWLLRVPRRLAVVLSLGLLWLYVQITGAGAPAARAFLMIAFLLGSRVFHLPGNSLAALAAAALVTLLLDPLQLFSSGFQMSYTVVLALVVMGVPLGRRWLAAWRPFAGLPAPNWGWHHHRVNGAGRWLIGGAAACWSAFLASTPAGIGYFHVFSPGSLLANLIIIPVASLAIVAGFLSLLLGLAGLLPCSLLFNSSAAVLLLFVDWLVRHGTELPGVYFAARFSPGWLAPPAVAGMVAVLLAGTAGRWSRRYGGYWPPAVVLALFIIFGVKFG